MPRRTWILLTAAWLAVAAVLLAWLVRTPAGLLREHLKTLQFWSLEICVLVGLALGIVTLRDLGRRLTRADWFRMTVLAAAALCLTVFVAPRTNRIYYDEQIYQSIGQNMAALKLAQMCNDGNVEYGRLQCGSGEYNKQPYAYPHMLSLAYRAFGVHETTAFVVNAVAMALTVCAVYLLVLILFGDRVAAFFAGLLMALIPHQLLWSATAAVEPSASLAAVAALLCAAHFIRGGRTSALAGAGVAAAYAVQFRPESFLIVPVIFLLLCTSGTRGELDRPRLWWVALLSFALVAVHIGHMFAVRNEGWGTSEARLSLQYLGTNLGVNGWF
ncbi:MAG: glycosyltransferase family 39 protein, partial [Vicinamibacterales bacterium]